jgi:hypothetical protein
LSAEIYVNLRPILFLLNKQYYTTSLRELDLLAQGFWCRARRKTERYPSGNVRDDNEALRRKNKPKVQLSRRGGITSAPAGARECIDPRPPPPLPGRNPLLLEYRWLVPPANIRDACGAQQKKEWFFQRLCFLVEGLFLSEETARSTGAGLPRSGGFFARRGPEILPGVSRNSPGLRPVCFLNILEK